MISKKIIFLLVFIFLPVSASAKEKLSGSEIYRIAQQKRDKISSFQGVFKGVDYSKGKTSFTYHFWYKPENQSKSEYHAGDYFTIEVINGSEKWQYDSKTNIAEKFSNKNAQPVCCMPSFGIFKPLNSRAVRTPYSYIGDETINGVSCYLLEQDFSQLHQMLSKFPAKVASQFPKKVNIWLAKDNGVVMKVIVYIQGDKIVSEATLTEYQINHDIDDNVFSFNPPAGAQVSDFISEYEDYVMLKKIKDPEIVLDGRKFPLEKYVKWKRDLKTRLSAEDFTIKAGMLCVGCYYEFAVLDLKTGETKWSIEDIVYYEHDDPNIKQFKGTIHISVGIKPIVYEDIVVFDAGSNLVAFNIHTGEQLWRFKFGKSYPYPSAATPVIANNTLYFGTYFSGKEYSMGSFLAIDAHAGKQRWKMAIDGEILSSPAVDNDTVYFGSTAGLYAINCINGKQKWLQDNINEYRRCPLVIADEIGYIGANDKLIALDLKTKEIKWSYEIAYRKHPTSIDLVKDKLYVGFDSAFVCLDPKTGKELWKIKTVRGAIDRVVWIDGIIYFSAGLKIYGVDLNTGKQTFLLSLPIKKSLKEINGLAIRDGIMYVGYFDSIYAIYLKRILSEKKIAK